MNLFKPQVPEQKMHPNFKTFLLQGNGFDMDVLQNWAIGFKDRDNKFVKEFQSTFNPCFWELYLFAVLKEKKLVVDFSYPSPDFYVPDPGFIIEAVIASNSQDGLPENHSWRTEIPETDFNDFNRDAIIRQSNAIISKSKKYLLEYKHLEHVKSKPFIIALAPFDRPYFWLEAHRPIEAILYGHYVDEGLKTSNKVDSLNKASYLINSVIKDNGADIPLGIFNDSTHSHISAILYSTMATKGKVRALSSDPRDNSEFHILRYNKYCELPDQQIIRKIFYTERLLDGLHVFHNPFADYPLDLNIFKSPGVNQVYYDKTKNEWIEEIKHGDLVFRIVHTQTILK